MEKEKLFYTLMVLAFTTVGYGSIFAHNKKAVRITIIVVSVLLFGMAMIGIWL